jgi:hypothetical protein
MAAMWAELRATLAACSLAVPRWPAWTMALPPSATTMRDIRSTG